MDKSAAVSSGDANQSRPDEMTHKYLQAYPSLTSILTLLQTPSPNASTSSSSSSTDTRRIAGCILLLRLLSTIRQQPPFIPQTQSNPTSSDVSSSSSSSHPLYHLLPLIWSYLTADGFIYRIIRHRVTIPTIPVATAATAAANSAPSEAQSSDEIGRALLAELITHTDVRRELRSLAKEEHLTLIRQLCQELHNDRIRSIALGILTRLAQPDGKNDSVAPVPSILPSHEFSSLILTICNWPTATSLAASSSTSSSTPSPLDQQQADGFRALAWISEMRQQYWQLHDKPSTSSSSSSSIHDPSVMMDFMLDPAILSPLSTLFATNQSSIKFACLTLLNDYFTVVPPPSRSPAITRVETRIRKGLEDMLTNKIDDATRLAVLQLSRRVLNYYGPMFGSAPADGIKQANSSVGSLPSPHVKFLQLLSNIFTIELRLALDEFASHKPSDIERLKSTGRMKEQIVLECVRLFRFLVQSLIGGEDGIEGMVESPLEPYEWYNLPSTLLMHFKTKLDQCSEAMITYFVEVAKQRKSSTQSATNDAPIQIRRPHMSYECARALCEWINEEAETHRDCILSILPVLCTIPTPDATYPTILSIILPSISTLMDVAPHSIYPICLRLNMMALIVRDVILYEYSNSIREQAQLLLPMLSGDGIDASSILGDESSEIRASLTRGLLESLHRICNGFDVIKLLSSHVATTQERITLWQQIDSNHSKQLSQVVQASTKLCSSLASNNSTDIELSMREEFKQAQTQIETAQKLIERNVKK